MIRIHKVSGILLLSSPQQQRVKRFLCWRHKPLGPLTHPLRLVLVSKDIRTSILQPMWHLHLQAPERCFYVVVVAVVLVFNIKNFSSVSSLWAFKKKKLSFILFLCRRFSERGDKGWLRSLFVHKVDARKDAHSNLLSKKETSNLYKIQCRHEASFIRKCAVGEPALVYCKRGVTEGQTQLNVI